MQKWISVYRRLWRSLVPCVRPNRRHAFRGDDTFRAVVPRACVLIPVIDESLNDMPNRNWIRHIGPAISIYTRRLLNFKCYNYYGYYSDATERWEDIIIYPIYRRAVLWGAASARALALIAKFLGYIIIPLRNKFKWMLIASALFLATIQMCNSKLFHHIFTHLFIISYPYNNTVCILHLYTRSENIKNKLKTANNNVLLFSKTIFYYTGCNARCLWWR